MPLLGFGVYLIPAGAETERAVGAALATGYRHVDTAQAYGNEADVGRALRASGLARDEVFVTTKLASDRDDPEAELERSLERLGLDAVDLYLVHTPRGRAAARLAGDGAGPRARARPGASGSATSAPARSRVCSATATVPPAVNQVAVQPLPVPPPAARGMPGARGRARGVRPADPWARARRPGRGRGRRRHGRTPAQVLLRWSVERGVAVIPKSVREERIRENAAIFDFELGRRGSRPARSPRPHRRRRDRRRAPLVDVARADPSGATDGAEPGFGPARPLRRRSVKP